MRGNREIDQGKCCTRCSSVLSNKIKEEKCISFRLSNYVSCTIFYLREKERERTKSVCQDKLLSLSPEHIHPRTRLWIRHFIYDYTDTSRDPEMLHVNAYNLYNIRLMDEIGPFHHEPKQ